jgi:hypothetical protein
VTDRGIQIRGYFSHFVPWHEIRGINTSGYGGSRAINDSLDGLVTSSGRRYTSRRGGISTSGRRARLATIRVVRSSGRAQLLRAPLVTSWAPDPEFDNKARELRQLCVRYARGPAR